MHLISFALIVLNIIKCNQLYSEAMLLINTVCHWISTHQENVNQGNSQDLEADWFKDGMLDQRRI